MYFFREDGQIVGAILNIRDVKPHNYGRYVCRIEIGNAAHRIEMPAWIFGTPIHADENEFLPALALAIGAVILIFLLVFVIRYLAIYITIRQQREKKLCQMNATESMRIREVI